MPFVVALTGGISSGKTTTANAFSALGVPLIDADIIAREMVMPGSKVLASIIDYFGEKLLHSNGTLDRAQLRERIFSNEQEKNWLNNLLHPLIRKETEHRLQTLDAPYVLWVIPLLFENQLETMANRILVVDVSLETQIIRTMKRDNISRQQAEQIISSQISRHVRLEKADDIIYNDDNYTTTTLKQDVAQLHQQYLALSSTC